MNIRKAGSATIFALMIVVALAARPALADEFDQAMKLTFNTPVQVPGKVLPAGTYWFKMADRNDPSGAVPDRVMSVWNDNQSHIVTTFNVVPAETVKNPDKVRGTGDTSGKIVITLADRSPEPQALMDLTYPGRIEGQNFTIHYPDAERKSLSDFPRVTMEVGKNGVVETTDTHTSH